MNPTDPTRPPAAADDEVVSAVMDGEGTPAEVARVESDPVLASRMAELRAVRDREVHPDVARRGTAGHDRPGATGRQGRGGGRATHRRTSSPDRRSSRWPGTAGRPVRGSSVRRQR